MKELTTRQLFFLRTVQDLTEANGYPPTRTELQGALGYKSPNSVESYLSALEKKGALTVKRGIARGIILNKHTVAEQAEAI